MEQEDGENEMSEIEFAGMKFKGGKMIAVLTALSTLGGGLWGGFEFYKDYMDMKEIIQNIDIDKIQAANELQLQKLEDAIGYTQDIKGDLKADIDRLETFIGTLEDKVVGAEDTVRALRTEMYAKLDAFEERLRLTLKDNQDTMANLRDTISTNLENSEARIKNTQASIDGTLEGVRNEMNQLQKDVTSSIREVENTVRLSEKDVRETMKETVKNLEEKMDKLEADIKQVIQEAFNNPLSK